MTLIHLPYINKDICLLKKKKLSYMYINKDICLPKKKKMSQRRSYLDAGAYNVCTTYLLQSK